MKSPASARRFGAGAAIAVLNLLPVWRMFYNIHRYGVDVPVRDELGDFVRILGARDQGTLNLHILLGQHDAHRLLFPRLLTLANAALFHWDRRAEMYASGLLLLLAAAIFFRMAQEYWGHRLTPLFFIPIAWTLLGWQQYANLLRGFQVQICMEVAGAIAAVWLLQNSRDALCTALAAAAAFVATFSFSTGLFIWPIGLLQLILRRTCGPLEGRPGRRSVVLWTTAGIFSWVLYFAGYQLTKPFRPPGYLGLHPMEAVSFFLRLIGSFLSFRTGGALWFGIAITLLTAYAVFAVMRLPRKHWSAAAPFLSLIALTLTACGSIWYGRFGTSQPVMPKPRYCTFIVPGLAAVYAVLLRCSLVDRRRATLVAFVAMSVALTVAAVTNLVNWSDDPAVVEYLQAAAVGKYVARNVDVLSDTGVRWIQLVPASARWGIPILRAHSYSMFREPAPPGLPANYLGQSTACAIDTINDSLQNPVEVHRQSQDGLEVHGWAVDAPAGDLPARVFVSFDNQDFPAFVGMPRPDVAASLHHERYQHAGVLSYPRLSLIPDGYHVLTFKIVNHNDSGYWTCSARSIRVTD